MEWWVFHWFTNEASAKTGLGLHMAASHELSMVEAQEADGATGKGAELTSCFDYHAPVEIISG